MKTYWGSGSIAPRILNLGTRWGKPPPPYPVDGMLSGPRSRSGRGGWEWNPGRSSHSLATILTELPGLLIRKYESRITIWPPEVGWTRSESLPVASGVKIFGLCNRVAQVPVLAMLTASHGIVDNTPAYSGRPGFQPRSPDRLSSVFSSLPSVIKIGHVLSHSSSLHTIRSDITDAAESIPRCVFLWSVADRVILGSTCVLSSFNKEIIPSRLPLAHEWIPPSFLPLTPTTCYI